VPARNDHLNLHHGFYRVQWQVPGHLQKFFDNKQRLTRQLYLSDGKTRITDKAVARQRAYGQNAEIQAQLLAERGLDLSYETVRRWGLKFAPSSPAICSARAIAGISMRWWCGFGAGAAVTVDPDWRLLRAREPVVR
jgi:hypothetical protein